MKTRRVGYMARRMNRRWPRGIGIVFPFIVGALAAFPITWTLEQTGALQPNWAPLYAGLASAAGALSVYGLVRLLRDRWRRRNGSLVYLGAQYGVDLDVERAKHCVELASANGSPFEEPPRYRSDSIDPTEDARVTADTLRRNFDFLFRADNDASPTGVISNMPWPYAVRYGYDLASRDPSELYIWHLRDNRFRIPETNSGLHKWLPSRWLGNDLQDVMYAPNLIPPYPNNANLKEGRLDVLAVEVSGPLAASALLDGATSLTYKPSNEANIKILRGNSTDEQWFHDSCEFVAFARDIAATIDGCLRAINERELSLAARLPKPVALAVGYALYHRGVRLPLAAECPFNQLAFYEYEPARDRFNRIFFGER